VRISEKGGLQLLDHLQARNTLLLPSLASNAAAVLGVVMSNWISLPEGKEEMLMLSTTITSFSYHLQIELTCELIPTPVDVL